MRNYQTFIKACREEYVYLEITIISSEDYGLLIGAIKKLKNDKNSLMEQLDDLRDNDNDDPPNESESLIVKIRDNLGGL